MFATYVLFSRYHLKTRCRNVVHFSELVTSHNFRRLCHSCKKRGFICVFSLGLFWQDSISKIVSGCSFQQTSCVMYCLRGDLLLKRRQTKHNLVAAQKEFAFYSVFFFQEQFTRKLHNPANDPHLLYLFTHKFDLNFMHIYSI